MSYNVGVRLGKRQDNSSVWSLAGAGVETEECWRWELALGQKKRRIAIEFGVWLGQRGGDKRARGLGLRVEAEEC